MDRLVQNVNGKAVTTSRKVAETFEKQHKDVLKAIRELEMPEDFRERNFAPTVYVDSTGRKLPEYLITRDGFTLLAMGFTGKKAMQFKVAYIEAFNAMEEELKNLCCCEYVPRKQVPTGDVVNSTLSLIDMINCQLLSGTAVDKDILQYTAKIAHMAGRQIALRVAIADPEPELAFILDFPPGKYLRRDIYNQYCANCKGEPTSARCFWTRVKEMRKCRTWRTATDRGIWFL